MAESPHWWTPLGVLPSVASKRDSAVFAIGSAIAMRRVLLDVVRVADARVAGCDTRRDAARDVATWPYAETHLMCDT